MQTEQAGRPRAREAGLVLGTLPPGPRNAITDVDGVLVGHATLISGDGPLVPGRGPVRTGVTAVAPHGGDLFAEKVPAAAEVFNGFGKTIGLVQVAELGQLETPILLTNTLNVGKVADALVGHMIERHPAIGISAGNVNPVVAECHDGYLNDMQGRHVGEAEVRAALAEAALSRGGPVAEGNVGGGTGMTAYGFAGGIGTASRRLDKVLGGWTVGALVQANFGRRRDLTIGGAPVGRELPSDEPADAPGATEARAERDRGSVIVVLATDAPLDARQLGRLARRAALGLARTGTYSGHGSGDLAIAFSTADRIPLRAPEPVRTVRVLAEESRALDGLFLAAVESVEEAVINALFRARTMVGRDGHRREALPLEPTLAILRRNGIVRGS